MVPAVSVRESEAGLLAPQKDVPCLLTKLHALGADTAHCRQAPAEQWPNQLPTPHVKPPSETATDPWAGGCFLTLPKQSVVTCCPLSEMQAEAGLLCGWSSHSGAARCQRGVTRPGCCGHWVALGTLGTKQRWWFHTELKTSPLRSQRPQCPQGVAEDRTPVPLGEAVPSSGWATNPVCGHVATSPDVTWSRSHSARMGGPASSPPGPRETLSCQLPGSCHARGGEAPMGGQSQT